MGGKKMKSTIEKLEEELRKWRSGGTVGEDEQAQLGVMEESMMSSAQSMQQLVLDKPSADLCLTSSHISQVDRSKIMEEREKLLLMLDEKDDEIQEQSGMVEKLKEQMVEQEELIGSARRDYENLTKEMSKIQ